MTASSIIEYIDQYDGDVRHRLLTVYDLIRSAVPDEAEESISWRMPTFKLGTEPLFFFTGTKRHIGGSIRLQTRSCISRQSWLHMEPPSTLSSCAMMPRSRPSSSAR